MQGLQQAGNLVNQPSSQQKLFKVMLCRCIKTGLKVVDGAPYSMLLDLLGNCYTDCCMNLLAQKIVCPCSTSAALQHLLPVLLHSDAASVECAQLLQI